MYWSLNGLCHFHVSHLIPYLPFRLATTPPHLDDTVRVSFHPLHHHLDLIFVPQSRVQCLYLVKRLQLHIFTNYFSGVGVVFGGGGGGGGVFIDSGI